jgi:hypothetical protein
MSAYLYEVCLIVPCLFSTYVCLPVWLFPTCMMSAYLHDVCSTVWCLPNCIMTALLNDVCLPVWCLLNCMVSAQLYNDRSTEWCLPTCMISSYLYDVCLPVWCLLYSTMSSYLYDIYICYDVRSTVWCLPTWMMSDLLYDVCLPDWLLPTYMMYALMCNICQPVWCYLLTYMMSFYPIWCMLYCVRLATLLSNSEIYIPRNALAPALLWNLKYNFPKQKYKILKSRRTYKWDREFYIFLRFIYLELERHQNEFSKLSNCMCLEPLNFWSLEECLTTALQNFSI